MLSVFQRVEPMHETQTGFSLFLNNDQPSFLIGLFFKGSTFQNEFKRIHMYIRNIPFFDELFTDL